MRFLQIFAVAAASLAFSPVLASPIPEAEGKLETRDLTPQNLINNINILTAKATALLVPAQSINIVNAFGVLVGQGPLAQVITGLNDIANTITSNFHSLAGTPIFRFTPDEENVFTAFAAYVTSQEQLLSTLVAQNGIIQNILFGPNLANAIRSVEVLADTLAYGIIDLIPDVYDEAVTEKDGLDNAFDAAIAALSD